MAPKGQKSDKHDRGIKGPRGSAEESNIYKEEYSNKIKELLSYRDTMSKTAMKDDRPSQEILENLNREVDKAHKKWFAYRNRSAEHEKAIKGKTQKMTTLKYWLEEKRDHMEYLKRTRPKTEWHTDKYWQMLPARIQQATKTCKEYEKMLAEFLPICVERDNLHLETCRLCGEIILGHGPRENTLDLHMTNAHWTSK